MTDPIGPVRRGFAIIMLLSPAIILIASPLARYQSDRKIHEKKFSIHGNIGPSYALYYGGIEKWEQQHTETCKVVKGKAAFFAPIYIARRHYDDLIIHTNFGITPVSLQKRDTKIDTTLVRDRTKSLFAGAWPQPGDIRWHQSSTSP